MEVRQNVEDDNINYSNLKYVKHYENNASFTKLAFPPCSLSKFLLSRLENIFLNSFVTEERQKSEINSFLESTFILR